MHSQGVNFAYAWEYAPLCEPIFVCRHSIQNKQKSAYFGLCPTIIHMRTDGERSLILPQLRRISVKVKVKPVVLVYHEINSLCIFSYS